MGKVVLGVFCALFCSGSAMAETTAVKAGQAFGGWVFRCTAIAQGKTSCAFVSTILSGDKKHVVAEVEVTRASTGKGETLSALLPLGTDLQAGVKGAVDGGAAFDLPLRLCLPKGCVAATGLDDKATAALRTGKAFAFTFTIAGKSAKATVPLTGLSDALTAANW